MVKKKGRTMPNHLLVTSHVYTAPIKDSPQMTLPVMPPDIQANKNTAGLVRQTDPITTTKEIGTCTSKTNFPRSIGSCS